MIELFAHANIESRIYKDFVVDCDKVFTRLGKLDLKALLHLMISMGGNRLNKEILTYFDYNPNTCSK